MSAIFAPSSASYGAAVTAPTALSTRRLVLAACQSQIVMTIACSRLALPFGVKQIPLTFLVAVAHLGIIALLTRGAFSPVRLLAALGAFVVVAAETLLVHERYSVLSIMYVVGIYGPLVLNTVPGTDALPQLWRTFTRLAAVLAALALVQILGQFAGGYFVDPVTLLPADFQLGGYQATYPIMRGVIPTLKPNGMLAVEPSALSQFLAVGLLGELWLFRRWRRVVLLSTALIVSFSGTGLLVFGVALLVAARPRVLLAVAIVGGVAAMIVSAAGYGEAFTTRIDEVRRPGTSGYERFVAPYLAMREPWHDSPTAVWFGYGAGRVEDLDVAIAANFSAIPKVFLEYGLTGLLAFAVLWLAMFCRLGVPRQITSALLLMYFVVGGAFLQPFTVFTLWGLTGGFMKRSRPATSALAREAMPA